MDPNVFFETLDLVAPSNVAAADIGEVTAQQRERQRVA